MGQQQGNGDENRDNGSRIRVGVFLFSVLINIAASPLVTFARGGELLHQENPKKT